MEVKVLQASSQGHENAEPVKKKNVWNTDHPNPPMRMCLPSSLRCG